MASGIVPDASSERHVRCAASGVASIGFVHHGLLQSSFMSGPMRQ
jgi:hypothetical protein